MTVQNEPTNGAEPSAASADRSPYVELYWRSISGGAAAIVTLALILAGPLPFAFLVLAVALIASWEWASLVRTDGDTFTLFAHALALTVAICLTVLGMSALATAALLIGVIVLFALDYRGRPTLSALGVLVTGLPAIALVWIREDAEFGLFITLLIMGVVIATDTGAYVVGKLWGGPKLAPDISPNKTWSGAIGGLLGGSLAALAFAFVGDGLLIPTLVLGLALSIATLIGDLGESALKRACGAKDAGTLMPGHGGLLDRVDGLCAAAIVAGVIALVWSPDTPAAALFWGP